MLLLLAEILNIISLKEILLTWVILCQVYSNSDFWIGYNDIDNEGDWVWSDRTTSSYTNWDDKSPNNGGVSCAIVTSTGRWHDEPCQSQYSFICKKPSKCAIRYLHFSGLYSKTFFFYSKIIGPKTLLLLIDFIHDTRHLCKRFRTDGLKAMSRGFPGTNKC